MNIQKLFEELDARHYASKISSAGFRVEMRELIRKISHTEFYGTTGFFEVGGTELGYCIFPAKLIVINRHLGRLPFGHDRETAIRATLLHEMAHAHVESQQRTRRVATITGADISTSYAASCAPAKTASRGILRYEIARALRNLWRFPDGFFSIRRSARLRGTRPAPRMKKAVHEILKFEMQHVPAAIAVEMTSSRLKTLGKALVEIIEDRDTRKWVDVVYDLRDELRRAIAQERESGRLQPWSADKEIKDHLAELAAKGWSGRIVEHLRALLRKGELLQSVEYFAIMTNQRRLERTAIRDAGRTVTETNDRNYSAQFLSDNTVRQLESDAAERASRANVPPWSQNYNHDLPRRHRWMVAAISLGAEH